MQNTRLINLLRTFSKEEIKDFEKFIVSPFHTQKRDVTKYFNLIKKFHPSFDSPSLNSQNLFNKLYPGTKYNEERMRLNNSFLYKMAKDFLVHSSLNSDEIRKEMILLEEFYKRGLDSAFDSQAKKIDKDLTPLNFTLEDFFTKKKDFDSIVYRHNQNKSNVDGIENDLDRKINSRAGLFFTGYLRELIVEQILNYDYSPDLSSGTLDKLKQCIDLDTFFDNKLPDNNLKLIYPVFHIYKYIVSLLKEGSHDEATFNKAKNIFLDNIGEYSRQEKFKMFENLLNLYYLNTSLGNRSLVREEFDMLKLQLKHNAFTPDEKSYISNMQFRNILVMGVDIKEYDWTEKFIDGYSKYLRPSQRDNIVLYSKALLEYRRGNPGKALEYSVKVKYDTFIFKRDLKLILLRLFFEEKLFEQARYFYDSSKRYTKKTDELSGQMKEYDINFMKYYGKLLNLSEKPDPAQAVVSLKCLNDEKAVTNKAWLTRQFQQFSETIP